MKELPEKFIESMKNVFGYKFEKFMEAFNSPPAKGVVINANYVKSNKMLGNFEKKLEKLQFFNYGYKLKTEEKLGNSWFHHAGAIYLQEPSSMLAANVLKTALEDVKDPICLDLCASPGGKTIDLALNLERSGLIVANEIIPARASVLFSNVERLGLKNVVISNNSPAEIAKQLPNLFDGVLVDAPCSGEGMFRKDPETIQEWHENLPIKNQKRQIEILAEAVKCLKTNGYLVYSTCTYNTLENEEVINYAINNLNLKILSVDKKIENITDDGINIKGCPSLKLARRSDISSNLGEGQFICLMQKMQNSVILGQNLCKNAKKDQNFSVFQEVKKVTQEFLSQTITSHNGFSLHFKNNEAFLISDKTPKKIVDAKLNYLTLGIKVGLVAKGRLIPHHQFFRAFYDRFKNSIELDDLMTQKYLQGEELECQKNLSGYAVVTHNQIPLGGAKAVDGKLKNFYPKGLRSKTITWLNDHIS